MLNISDIITFIQSQNVIVIVNKQKLSNDGIF